MDQQAANTPKIDRSRTHGLTHHHINTADGSTIALFAQEDRLGRRDHHVACTITGGGLYVSLPDLTPADARELAAALLAAADDVEKLLNDPRPLAVDDRFAFGAAAQ